MKTENNKTRTESKTRKRRNCKVTSDMAVQKMIEKGLHVSEAAKQLKCNECTVREKLKDVGLHGITFRELVRIAESGTLPEHVQKRVDRMIDKNINEWRICLKDKPERKTQQEGLTENFEKELENVEDELNDIEDELEDSDDVRLRVKSDEIRKKRLELGYTRREVSELSGVDLDTYEEIEDGTILAGAEDLSKIAEALKTNWFNLVDMPKHP